jgi:hypothetical protein
MGKRLLGIALCGSNLWLWAICSRPGKIPRERRSPGSVCTVAILPHCVLAKDQMALDERAAPAAPVPGNPAVFSDNHSVPPICSSLTGQAASGRFGRLYLSARSNKTRSNSARLLSHSNCPALYGAIDARDGSAIRYSSCLCHRHGSGLLQFLARHQPDYLVGTACFVLLGSYGGGHARACFYW